jgi:hypothetical protein
MPSVPSTLIKKRATYVKLHTDQKVYTSHVTFTVVESPSAKSSSGGINISTGNIEASTGAFDQLQDLSVGDQVTISWTGSMVMYNVRFSSP